MDSTKILWEDIDFDGFEDALILVDVASNTSYESFLFDSKNKQYMHLRTIRNTALDKKRKMLLYSIHMGGGESSLYGFKIHKQKEYSIFIAHKRNETVRIFDNKMNLILTNNKGEELDEVTENFLESTPSIWKNVTQEPRQLLDWAEFWKMLDKMDKNKIVPNNK